VMGREKFYSDEEVQQVVHEWLCRWPQFFSRGIHTLCKRWRACIKRNGDYVEKWYSCVLLSFNKLNNKMVFIWLTLIHHKKGSWLSRNKQEMRDKNCWDWRSHSQDSGRVNIAVRWNTLLSQFHEQKKYILSYMSKLYTWYNKATHVLCQLHKLQTLLISYCLS
jgi:hypothetical protein